MCVRHKKQTRTEFVEYMEAQISAISKSGMTSAEWVAKHAESFRRDYENQKRSEDQRGETRDSSGSSDD